MSKHVRRTRRSHLKAIASVVVVVVFLVFAVGGAFGWIGGPKTPADGTLTAVDEQLDDDAGEDPSAESTDATEGTEDDEPDQAVQKVKQAQKLKRTIAWLRRGLADETTFRVASFNVLGSSHTAKGGNRKGFASGATRMGGAVSLIRGAQVSVVGFQEFEHPQYYRFLGLTGGNWKVFPGPTLDRGSIRNSLAWNTDVWELVEARSVGIPYFGGQIIRRPLVLLRNLESDREVWFFNTHNPADVHGNQARHRAGAISIQIRLANELSADGTPVVYTGDFNDRAAAFCPLTSQTPLEASAGGTGDSGCVLPAHPGVDWIFGSGMEFTAYASVTRGVVGRVSDHPFVYAEAHIPKEPLETAKPKKPQKR